MPAAKKGRSFPTKSFPRAFIWWMASAGKVPCTTDTLTPAFSKVLPFWITQVTPPPPSFLVHRSTLNFVLESSSFSSARQKSAYILKSLTIELTNETTFFNLNLHDEQFHLNSHIILICDKSWLWSNWLCHEFWDIERGIDHVLIVTVCCNYCRQGRSAYPKSSETIETQIMNANTLN